MAVGQNFDQQLRRGVEFTGKFLIIGGDFCLDSLMCSKHEVGYDRVFAKSHTEIECDPSVWKQVELLIRSKLPPATPGTSTESRNP